VALGRVVFFKAWAGRHGGDAPCKTIAARGAVDGRWC